ncbi:alcohol dehydrogenase GroES-like domain-containing protein [Colletotrichum salicis]|uniref:Alcohol dehydrogenase GroES-like domain-containing protein n=1 Tax=Colletotrichum salicis TaxID=1209931 RepID=A0A135SHV7_9PEZI|nr:alcohol dehydrogenase GroES-like domain-containing protein [Colletotrichum salicis]
MRAVAWFGQPYNVSVIDMPVPTILNQTDVVVRITSSAICGSDLYMYRGFGGYVSSVGDAVSSLTVGDYVIVPDNADDGHWGPCTPYLLALETQTMEGCKSSLRRHFPLSPSITSTNNTAELDCLMISDVFTTGWHVLSYSGFQPGDTVATFGAGPVGLLAAYSAKLRGASRVEPFGAIPIDFPQEDPVEAILNREPGGVTRSVDCVGFESVNATGDPLNGIMLENMVAVTAVYGGMSISGVYNGGANSTEGAPNAGTLPAEIPIPMASLWRKGMSVGRGIILPLLRAPPLLNLISSGVAKPSFVVTAEIDIEDAPEHYRRYSDHLENKVVIRFP